MMRKTHRAFASAFWLGSSLAVDALAIRAGISAPISPAVVVAGVLVAPVFSAGKTSPDIDRMWAPGPPTKTYDWKGHRGFTHRFWFASVLGAASIGLYFLLLGGGLPASLATFAFVPVVGWWSHLFGDMIFGRLLILGEKVGLGWETNGLAEKGGKLWRDPAAQVSTAGGAVFGVGHLILLAQSFT